MLKMKINSKKPKIIAIIGVVVITGIVVGFLIVKANPDFVSDTFTDETKIGKGTALVEISTTTGQVTLAPCYVANPSWTKVADTIVRDITTTSNALATTSKDIYCDNYNCILVTDEWVPPSTICIATNPNVYGNILWSKTDSGYTTWGPSTYYIYGNDIGGTHPSDLRVGANNYQVGAKKWLERYYESAPGTYPAMDACKAKGSGWRLPTILELDSIRDQAKGAAPYTRLPNIFSDPYWSSSEVSASYAYSLDFNSGNVISTVKFYSQRVRCVREY
jgi:hypothetical protein